MDPLSIVFIIIHIIGRDLVERLDAPSVETVANPPYGPLEGTFHAILKPKASSSHAMHTASFPDSRPTAGSSFYKGHGLGNDYLVVDEGSDWHLGADAVQRVCHRHRGVGSDGIVWVAQGGPPFHLRMFNPDGGEFERSGNGLRVLASHLHRRGRVGMDPFRVQVGGDEVEMQILEAHEGRYDIRVAMGVATAFPEERVVSDAWQAELVRVSVGNPHAVVWGDPMPWEAAPDHDALLRLGPGLAIHPLFPQGTNVQLAYPSGPQEIQVRVWERGVGHTHSSGTSACAVAVAAVSTGRVAAGEVEIVMEGGTLFVQVDADLDVHLRGPVEAVMEGRLAALP